MPVYKGDTYLSDAVDSILNQTFKHFELIIICDDPTDETRQILDQYMQSDRRVKAFYQERQGLVKSLNKGLSIAKGIYIARMDADDISLASRLEKQVEFMDNNPEIGVSGTWVKPLGKGLPLPWKSPCNHEAIKAKLLFESVMAHPTVIIRKDIFCENHLCYSLDETYAEDYGLWVRAIKVVKIGNIPEALLLYRMHSSSTNPIKQKEVANKIRLSQLRQLEINPSKIEFQTHEMLSQLHICGPGVNKEFVYHAKNWLEKLQSANLRMKIYSEPSFSTVLADYWYSACCNSLNSGFDSWSVFNNSKLSNYTNLSYFRKAVLLLTPNVKRLANAINLQ